MLHSVVSLRSVQQAVCPGLPVFGTLSGSRSTVTDQRFHNFMSLYSQICPSLWFPWYFASLFGSPVRNWRFTMPCIFLTVLMGPKGRTERKKTKEVCPILSGSQFYLLERKVPFTQSFKPLQVPVTPEITAATLGMSGVRGVRTERRGGKMGEGFPAL